MQCLQRLYWDDVGRDPYLIADILFKTDFGICIIVERETSFYSLTNIMFLWFL